MQETRYKYSSTHPDDITEKEHVITPLPTPQRTEYLAPRLRNLEYVGLGRWFILFGSLIFLLGFSLGVMTVLLIVIAHMH